MLRVDNANNWYYVDCFEFTNKDYAACLTRATEYDGPYFKLYEHVSAGVYKDCWTYAATHTYADCETRKDKGDGLKGFTNKETTAYIDCWSYQSGTQADLYTACKARSEFVCDEDTGYFSDYYIGADKDCSDMERMRFQIQNVDTNDWVECFWFSTETFAECETRTKFEDARALEGMDLVPFFNQHYFVDKSNADPTTKVDCWRFAYENYANCVTRSTYQPEGIIPLTEETAYMYFKNKEDDSYVECFDYKMEYAVCKKRLDHMEILT